MLHLFVYFVSVLEAYDLVLILTNLSNADTRII